MLWSILYNIQNVFVKIVYVIFIAIAYQVHWTKVTEITSIVAGNKHAHPYTLYMHHLYKIRLNKCSGYGYT